MEWSITTRHYAAGKYGSIEIGERDLFVVASYVSEAISEATRHVTQKQEQIYALQKLDQRIENKEEEKTTEGVC